MPAIGPKIRGLRLKKLLSLVQLGEHTGAVYNVFNIQRSGDAQSLPLFQQIA